MGTPDWVKAEISRRNGYIITWDVTFGIATHVYVQTPDNLDDYEAHRVAREELAKVAHTTPDRVSGEWSARVIAGVHVS